MNPTPGGVGTQEPRIVANSTPLSVAIVPWGDWIEDYTDGIGIDLDAVCNELDGGWLFGYVRALQAVDARPFLVAVSREIARSIRRIHRPTGAAFWFLPSPARYKMLRRTLPDPYAMSAERALRTLTGARRVAGRLARHLAPYLAWPASSFSKVLAAERCDVILAQEYEYARFDLLVLQARRRRMPVFASFQGGTWHASMFEDAIRPRSVRLADGLIVGSLREADRVTATYGLSDSHVHWIPNPIDLSSWTMPSRRAARQRLGISDAARVVAWHGRISINPKGLDVLLDAWAILQEKVLGPNDRLVLIGDGDDTAAFRAMMERKRLEGIQWRSEFVLDKAIIREALAAADVYAFPSRHEGFPVALVEALASGLPVVAADAHGAREIVGASGVDSAGILVPVGDAAALAEGVSDVLSSGERAAGFARRARQRVSQTFDLEAVGKQLLGVLTKSRIS